MSQCRWICLTGKRCVHGASIDGLCITHFRMEYGHPKTKHVDYKTYNVTIELWDRTKEG